MIENAQAMVLASFAADALALGAHWIYDTDVIDREIGRPDAYRDPQPRFHATKKAGDFTHYGDQALVLLESVAESSGFDLRHFAAKWQDFFADYDGYFDGATKKTLANLEAGASLENAGSTSDDLAGAGRIAPLAYCYRRDPDRLAAAARAQTAFTHNHPHVIESAALFGQIALSALEGTSPRKALTEAKEGLDANGPLVAWLTEGLESAGVETRRAIGGFGQMCEAPAAFPATVHLIAKFEDNLPEALIENVLAGGDSAGRGLLAGMVLGAYQGLSAIPEHWLTELNARDRIMSLIEELDAESK